MNKSIINGKSVTVSCMACGKCSESCPVQIDIMESLKIYKDYLDGNKNFEKNIEVFPNSIRIFKKYTSWKLPELKQNHDEAVNKLMGAYR